MTSSETPLDSFGQGVDAYRRGDLPAARAAFEAALEQRPESTATLCNLAGVLGSGGDFVRAVELYDRALKIDPNLAEALAGLAWALPMAGRDDRMPDLVARWLEVAPHDAVARHLAASLGRCPAPPRCEGRYIETFFDGFAPTYDQTLEDLTYRAPEQLVAMLGKLQPGAPTADLDIIDAGCGTGLCGPLLRPFARHLRGVDLSTEMLQRAVERGAYDELVHGDLVAALASWPASADVVVSADVLVYFGDLAAPFEAAAHALRPGGRFLASVELRDEGDFGLEATGRYEHSDAYVRRALAEAGLEPTAASEAPLRFDRGHRVRGLVFCGQKPTR